MVSPLKVAPMKMMFRYLSLLLFALIALGTFFELLPKEHSILYTTVAFLCAGAYILLTDFKTAE